MLELLLAVALQAPIATDMKSVATLQRDEEAALFPPLQNTKRLSSFEGSRWLMRAHKVNCISRARVCAAESRGRYIDIEATANKKENLKKTCDWFLKSKQQVGCRSSLISLATCLLHIRWLEVLKEFENQGQILTVTLIIWRSIGKKSYQGQKFCSGLVGQRTRWGHVRRKRSKLISLWRAAPHVSCVGSWPSYKSLLPAVPPSYLQKGGLCSFFLFLLSLPQNPWINPHFWMLRVALQILKAQKRVNAAGGEKEKGRQKHF